MKDILVEALAVVVVDVVAALVAVGDGHVEAARLSLGAGGGLWDLV